MSGWTYDDGEYPSCSYSNPQPYRPEQNNQQPPQEQPPAPAQPLPPENPSPFRVPAAPAPQIAQKEPSPREIRNKAEKDRRDKMSQLIARLMVIVPPVAYSDRKVDKTSVLRLTAHYIRAYKHVFGNALCSTLDDPQFGMEFTKTFLKAMKGFVITVTYKGLVVVVSPNIQEYLGYAELDLLGKNFYDIIHPEDHPLLVRQLFPKSCRLTTNGELLLSSEPDSAAEVAENLRNEKRSFIVRFKKQTHVRSAQTQYVTCHVQGSFRKSDGAGVYVDRVVQIGRRVRSRGNNPYASGNDIVFIGMVRPLTETFLREKQIEDFTMQYRTRHSVDGEIIQCEQRIGMVTGYMIHEVKGTNAMNFMHKDDVRWVIVALRHMYDRRSISGQSCYRLMTKSGTFIYMRTEGHLEVDPVTHEVTSFVCLNTVVPEEEGKRLILEMKTKYSLLVNRELPKEEPEPDINQISRPSLPVEDPKQLKNVIFHLVTDLPAPSPAAAESDEETPIPRLFIIPPKPEQIIRAIDKSYSVIRMIYKADLVDEHMNEDRMQQFAAPSTSPDIPRHLLLYLDEDINSDELDDPNPPLFLDYHELEPSIGFDYLYNPDEPQEPPQEPNESEEESWETMSLSSTQETYLTNEIDALIASGQLSPFNFEPDLFEDVEMCCESDQEDLAIADEEQNDANEDPNKNDPNGQNAPIDPYEFDSDDDQQPI